MSYPAARAYQRLRRLCSLRAPAFRLAGLINAWTMLVAVLECRTSVVIQSSRCLFFCAIRANPICLDWRSFNGRQADPQFWSIHVV